MIYTNLYEEVLIKPCQEGADKLKIVSGYASSAMAFHHLEELKKKKYNIHISLLLGMCPADGISYTNHNGFLNTIAHYSKQFTCGYICNPPPVHSKLYIWYRSGSLYKAFIGSANYTQNAFSKNQRESLAEIHDANVSDYFSLLEKDSIYCNHNEAIESVRVYNDENYYRYHLHEDINANNLGIIPSQPEIASVTIPLYSRITGEVQSTAGLNWGHRSDPRYHRNKNEAYIQLLPDIYKSDFFPVKPLHFTVVTDDSKTFICCRAQKGKTGDAIETPHNNALLGEYFRNRMGLADGAFVIRQNLKDYGREDVTFYKFDDENYYMDFSV
jgi:hypothetical protein